MEVEISTTKKKKTPSTHTDGAWKKDCGSNLWRPKSVQLKKEKRKKKKRNPAPKLKKQGRKIVDLICGG